MEREWLYEFLKIDGNSNNFLVPIFQLEENFKIEIDVKNLIHKYKNITSKDLSPILNFQAHLKLKDNVKPIFLRARSVPFPLIPLVDLELEHLVKNKVLQKVDSSEFATPIVPVLKNNNRIRICGDFSVTINKLLEVDEHPLPTIDELLSTFSGGIYFSKLDLSEAYLQMPVDEESAKLLTLSTHCGLFRCRRLMYGINAAPAIWQRYMDNL